jgi:hypothetical protein
MSNQWAGPPPDPAPVGYGAGYAPPPVGGYGYGGAPYGPYGAMLPAARLGGLSALLRLLLTLAAAAGLAVLGVMLWRHNLLDRVYANRRVTLAEAQRVDHAVNLVALTTAIVFTLTIIVFIVWFYRVRANADYLGSYQQRRAKAWAILAWFTPVVWLWFPYQIATDAMAEARQAAHRSGRSVRDADGLLLGWWLSWVGCLLLVCLFTYTDSQGVHRPFSASTEETLRMFAAGFAVLAAICAVGVVARISAAQSEVMGGP